MSYKQYLANKLYDNRFVLCFNSVNEFSILVYWLVVQRGWRNVIPFVF